MQNALKKQIKAHRSMSKWAKKNGFHKSYISRVLRNEREIEERLWEALGFEQFWRWKPIKQPK
jgi:DNA-binding phage protein